MKKTIRKICFSAILILFTCSPALAGTVEPSLKSRLQYLSPEDEVAVIITLKDQLSYRVFRGKNKNLAESRTKKGKSMFRAKMNRAMREKADRTQKPLKEFLRQKKGRKMIPFWIFNGMAATIRVDMVEELAARPEVESIRPDEVITLSAPAVAASSTPEWNLNTINAPALWTLGYTGSGIIVANMDTGVDVLHPDLATRWRGGTNSWYDPYGEHAAPFDKSGVNSGHGTQTMGILVGGDAGGSAIGVAPGAGWIAVKLFNDAGDAPLSSIHLGFQWLLDPDGDPGTDDLPDVVNNSWGFDTRVGECYREFEPDIQALKAAGVAVVFSAGNQGPSGSTSVSPANYLDSFAVGAVDEFLTVADTSSRGPSGCTGGFYPELVAPGVNVHTADLTSGGVFPNSYATVSGTSFAAPHVAGAMALLLSVNPQLTVDELEFVLTQSTVDLGTPGWDNDYGKGLLDVEAAFNLLIPLTASTVGSGTISPENTAVLPGADQEFIMTPFGGSELLDVQVDGQSVGPVSSYTFTNVTVAHSIQAVFSQAKANILWQALPAILHSASAKGGR